MKLNNLRNYIGRIILVNLILTLISAGAVWANSVNPESNQKGFTGVWQLKRTITEKRAKQANFLLAVKETPESLILAVEEGVDEITINEGFKEFIQTQTLPTDGQLVSKNMQQLGKVSTKANWITGKLVVEIVNSQGDKIVQTFELSANRNLLNVSWQMTPAKSGKTEKIRRIYQRVGEPDENNTAQIGITVYPF